MMVEIESKLSRWWPAILMACMLVVAYPLRYVLLPFIAAAALAYIARPLVNLLKREWGFPHWAAALLPFLLFLIILSAIGYGIKSILGPQLAEMINNTPKVVEEFLDRVLQQFHLQNTEVFGQKLDPHVAGLKLVEAMKQAAGTNALAMVGGVFGLIAGAILTVVILGFFLFTGPHLARGTLWLFPADYRPRARRISIEIDQMLGSYLRGVFVIVGFTAIATYIATGFFFHVHDAILLSLAVGFLELVPVLGPIFSFVTFGLVAVRQTGIETIIAFGAFAIALRLAIDQLVGPLVLGRAARIPAVVVMFSFLAGGTLYGMLGVVLAIPFAATVKIVLADIYREGEEI